MGLTYGAPREGWLKSSANAAGATGSSGLSHYLGPSKVYFEDACEDVFDCQLSLSRVSLL